MRTATITETQEPAELYSEGQLVCDDAQEAAALGARFIDPQRFSKWDEMGLLAESDPAELALEETLQELEQLSKQELRQRHELVLGEKPPTSWTKAKLIEALTAQE